ncbi:hypothetical protein EOE18_03350 [Novosphingobium umbonatum]|uniref:Uncharacterized protein n=1 Tax=Novosphingobium umbonatum TaxID=1908524 RepID=A0A3S2UU59_9SPHN|nr:hypothetical protein [Novosphingobium umbonatum]RVU07005.1 hypothetical protein EOE18_03350 [Novosphingobium umbonatum]
MPPTQVALYTLANASPSRWRKAAGFIAFHIACSGLMVAILACTPDRQGRVAAIFPPWFTAGQSLGAVSAAEGRLIRFGNRDWIAVVAPPSGQQDFSGKLHAAGAVALVNPILVGGCDDSITPKVAQR